LAATFSTNTEELEIQAVLSGQVLGLLTGVIAAGYIRSGHLVPLLTKHVSDNASLFIYYGSRVAQPARVRAFIDHAIARLVDNSTYVVSPKELAAAEAKVQKALRIR